MDSDDPMTFVSCIMLTLNFIRAESGITYVLLYARSCRRTDVLVDRVLRRQGIDRSWPRSWTRSVRIPMRRVVVRRNGAFISGACLSFFLERSADRSIGTSYSACYSIEDYKGPFSPSYRGTSTLRPRGHPLTPRTSPTEPITPSQTTLLQLLDGYHHSSDWDSPAPSPHNETYAFLIPAFYDLARYAVAAMTPGVPRNGRDLEDDPKLARVLEAAIVVCQCLITVCLAETEHLAVGDELLSAVREAKEGERQFVEVLIGTSDVEVSERT